MGIGVDGPTFGGGMRGGPVRGVSAGSKWGLLLLLFLVGLVCAGGEAAASPGTGGDDPPPLPDFPIDTLLPTDPVGYLPGSGAVSAAGTAQYSVPLLVPPGRAGMQPALSIEYASGNGNGLLGVGFGVTGASAIRRCPRTLALDGVADGVDWTSADTYCLDGQKLGALGYDASLGAFVFRTERDIFARIEGVAPSANWSGPPDRFRVSYRDGRVYTYLPHQGSRRFIPPLAASAMSFLDVAPIWLLSTVSDPSGNTMTYHYVDVPDASGEHSLDYALARIDYTGSVDPTGPLPERHVEFLYEDRVGFDQPFFFEAGVRARMTRRLSAIAMYAPREPGGAAELIHQYKLSYALSDASFRTLLSRLELCDASDVCAFARTFTWDTQQDLGGIADVPISTTVVAAAAQEALSPLTWCWAPPPDPTPLVFDVDGDGRSDALYWDEYECIPTGNPEDGFWGKLVWHLKLRRSASGPLADETEVGTAQAAICQPNAEGDCSIRYSGFRLSGSRPADIDGDGAFELYMQRKAGAQTTYSLWRWSPPAMGFIKGPWTPQKRVELVDMSGDGLVDLVESVNDTWRVRLNQGPPSFDFGPSQNTGIPDTAETCKKPVRALDLDANGRGDILVSGANCASVVVGLNDAGMFGVTPSDIVNPAGAQGFELADLNGDGLRDLFWTPFDGSSQSGSPVLRWNSGAGYLAEQSFAQGPTGKHVLPIDANGDGREDILAAEATPGSSGTHDLRLYLSMANEPNGAQLFPFTLNTAPIPNQAGGIGLTSGDFDGDGDAEILEWVSTPGTGSLVFAQDLVIRQIELPIDPDKVVEVWDEGADHPREAFSYSRVWSDAPSSQACAYPQHCIRHGMTVVREHRLSQGQALAPSARKVLYAYDRPRMDVRGRGFLGFGEVRSYELGLYREEISTYDNVTRILQDGREMYPFAGTAVSTVSRVPLLTQPVDIPAPGLPMGVPRARTEVTARVPVLMAPTSVSYVTLISRWSTVESEEDVSIVADRLVPLGNATAHRVRQGATTYDVYANPLTASTSTTGGVVENRTTSYVNSTTTPWILGLPDRTEIVRHDASDPAPPPRVVDTDYDALGRPILVTVEPDAPGTPLWQQIQYVPTPEGLLDTQVVSVATGEPPRAVRYYYDTERVFVEQVRDSANRFASVRYERGLGVPVLRTDIRGVKTQLLYDGLGRVRRVIPDGGVPVTTTRSVYESAPGVVAGVTIDAVGDDGSAAWGTRDELGRATEGGLLRADGEWSVASLSYNLFGQQTKRTRPGIGAPSSAETLTVYDGLGRIESIQGPDGATTLYSHGFSESYVRDADGHLAHEQRDVDGRAISTSSYDGPASSHEIRTTYDYGDFGLLEKAVDAAGNVTTIGYDALGRRTYLDDPDRGPSAYSVNGFGEVTTVVDALLVPTVFTRDAYGRVTTVDDADGTRSFVWDTAPNGVGQIAQTESPDGVVVSYAYTPLGQLESESVTLDANGQLPETFVVEVAYDGFGRLAETRYPDVPGRARFTVQPVYGPTGELAQLLDVSDPQNSALLFQVDQRAADGALERATYGNGVVTQRDYDPETGRLWHIDMRPAGAATPTHAVGFDYTASGTLWARHDEVRGRLETFSYDGVDRLTGWSLDSTTGAFAPRDTTYAYDDLGNLTSTTANGAVADSALYGWGGKPHALAKLNGLDYTYDALGRQLDGPERTVDYTAFDLPKTITTKGSLGTIATYDYDATGTRVRKATPNEVTTYIGGLYEKRRSVGSAQHVFSVPAETGLAVQVVYDQATTTEQRYVLEEDLLGSPAGVLDGTGAEVEQRFHEPFGRRIRADGLPAAPSTSAVHVGFTGHEEDAETGLVNMRGRMYDPKQRRFLTADPFVGEPFFGQALNRYAYVSNNPLRYVDPTGFEGESGGTGQSPECGAGGECPITITVDKPRGTNESVAVPLSAGALTAPPGTQASDSRPTSASGPAAPSKHDVRQERTAGVAPLPNVVHSKPWAPTPVVRSSWEANIADAANPETPWYLRVSAGFGAITGIPWVAAEMAVHGVVAAPQLAVTEAVATGEHVGRAILLHEQGADEAVTGEVLQAGQAAATSIASAADTVVMVASVAPAVESAAKSLLRGASGGAGSPIVIGESMAKRVEPFAQQIGAETYAGMPGFQPGMETQGLAHNRAFLEEAMREGRTILDVGPDFARRLQTGMRSPNYEMERMLTKGYAGYRKAFSRVGPQSSVLFP
jgi:RHS repeat-associated protein